MKLFLILVCLASIGANVVQLRETEQLEDVVLQQQATLAAHKRLLEGAVRELVAEKQNVMRTVRSAQSLLDRSGKLLDESDRLAAENKAYRERYGAVEVPREQAPAIKFIVPSSGSAPTPVVGSTPPPGPTPTPTPAKPADQARKKN